MEDELAAHDIATTYNAYWQVLYTYFYISYNWEIPRQEPKITKIPYQAQFEIPPAYNPYFTHVLLTITRRKGEILQFVISNGESDVKEYIDPKHGILQDQTVAWLKKYESQNPKFTKFLNAMKTYCREHQLSLDVEVSVEQLTNGCIYVITPPPGFSHTTTHIELMIYVDDSENAKLSCDNTRGFNINTTFIPLKASDTEVEHMVKEWLDQNRGLSTTFIETIFKRYLSIMNAWFVSRGLSEIQHHSVKLKDKKEDGQDYEFTPPADYNPGINFITLIFNIDNEHDHNDQIPEIYSEDIMCEFKTGNNKDSEAEISDPVSEYINEIHNLMWRKTETIPEIPAHNKKAIENWLTKYHRPPPKESRLPRPADNLLRLDTKLTQLLSRFGQPP
jgi:hypothetical protein